MKSYILMIIGLLTIPAGCTVSSTANSSGSATNVSKSPPQTYALTSLVSWSLADKTRIEARYETFALPAGVSVSTSPPARLRITNLLTGQTVFEETNGDRLLSMYTRDLNNDWNDELILNWSGGSVDRIEILEIEAQRARVILKESYRIDAALIDLSGKGKIDVLIATGESGAGPFTIARYVWKNDRFVAVSRTPYARFSRIVSGLMSTGK